MKRLLSTLLALGLLAGVILAYNYIEENKVYDKSYKLLLWNTEDETISKVKVTNDNINVELVNENSKWMVNNESKDDAHTQNIQSILNSYKTLRATSLVEKKPKDLSQYGLDKDTTTVIFTTADNKEYKLIINKEKNFNNTHFVLYNSKVFTISDYLATRFDFENEGFYIEVKMYEEAIKKK